MGIEVLKNRSRDIEAAEKMLHTLQKPDLECYIDNSELRHRVLAAIEEYISDIKSVGLIPPWIKQNTSYKDIFDCVRNISDFKNLIDNLHEESWNTIVEKHTWALNAYCNKYLSSSTLTCLSLEYPNNVDEDYFLIKTCTKHWCDTVIYGT